MKHTIRNDPDKERGGGTGIAFKTSFNPTQIVTKKFTSFEHTVAKLPCHANIQVVFMSIYRLQYVPVATFFEEFSDFLETYTVMHDSFVITGDLNIHLDADKSHTNKFNDLWTYFN